jgi:hypothetical protein
MSSKMLIRGAVASGAMAVAVAATEGIAAAAPATYPGGGGGGTITGGGGATTVAVTGGAGTVASVPTSSGGGLPFTGFEAGAAAAIGLAAIGAGTVFVVGSRRRRSSGSTAA